MINEANLSEEKAKKAMVDAAKIAEELRSEQENAQGFAKERKLFECQVKDMQQRLDEAETNALKGGKKAMNKMDTRIRELEAEVHAESGEIIERNTKKMLQNGVFGPEGLAMAHSIEAEEEAVMRASTLANQVNCPLLIKSITSESAADIVRTKKGRGNVLYAEVSPASLACDGIEYWNSCW